MKADNATNARTPMQTKEMMVARPTGLLLVPPNAGFAAPPVLTDSVYPPPARPYRRGSCCFVHLPSLASRSTAAQKQSVMHAAWQSAALVPAPTT
jgi:hypothetical protein